MFFGPRIAKSYIISHLIRDLPTRAGLYEDYLGLESGYFQTPQKWYTFDPERRDYNPSVFVEITNSERMERISYDDYGNPYFLSYYPTTLVLWLADKSRREAIDYRDAYSSVLRDSIVRMPSLRPADIELECHVRVDETSIGEQFSEPIKEGNNNYWAGVALEFTTIVEETLDYPVQGIFREAKITLNHMAITPTRPRSVRAICDGTSCSVVWDEPSWHGGFYDVDSYEVQYTEVTHHDDDVKVPYPTDSYEDVKAEDYAFQSETHNWISAGSVLSADDYGSARSTTTSLGSDVIGGHTSQLITNSDYFTVTGLVSGNDYRFRVRAINEAGESEWSYSDVVSLS